MSIVNYQPWQLLQRFRRELDQTLATGDNHAAWTPAVDLREDDDRFTLQADLPGVDAKDIHVTADDGVLTIRGDRRAEKREQKPGYEYVERSSGSFVRRFSLPENAQAEQIKARHNNGVLEIVIPKRAAPQPRRIDVDVN